MKHKVMLMMALLTTVTILLSFASCAKKEVVKEEVPVAKQAVEQVPVQPDAEALAREKAMAEARERERQAEMERQRAMEKEKAMRDEAAAKIEREASSFADIHFEFDRYSLRPEDRKILEIHAKWLLDHPEYVVRIEGNCDERGTTEYNLALGEKRAMSARDYLVDLGVSTERVSLISYGEERPLDPGHNEEAWAKNRRDNFVVTKKK